MRNALIVLVVVPDGEGRYLVVRERDGSHYLPAGKVERGEDLVAAAVRETVEEAGVEVGVRGLLGFDHCWVGGGGKLRFCFVADPLSGAPKTEPDEHTLSAAFRSTQEIARLPLRHHEVLHWISEYERSEALLCRDAYRWIA